MPETPPLPRLTLCADDFAMSEGVSRTIARLARSGCINAISCMAAMPRWLVDGELLDGIEQVSCGHLGRVQTGLHLVLASERPLGAMDCTLPDGRLPGPDRMLALALMRLLDLAQIGEQIERQFAAFHAVRGRAPDFVDAHQHVHVYPGIRELVIAATRRHAPGAWVRIPDERPMAMLARPFTGKAIGSTLHALGMRRAVVRAGLRANASFAGHYDFSGPYADYLKQFLRFGSGAHLVMCHPGAGDDHDDEIGAARAREAEVIGQMPLARRLAAALPAPTPALLADAPGG